MLKKLNNLGIRGLPLQLFQNYLSNRTQITLINGKKSNFGHITHGVPQGSILGPILFLLYINDLPNFSDLDIKLFADDACLMLNDKNAAALENKVNTELVKINNWMNINKLTINYSKSNYIIFTNKNNSFKFNIGINGIALDQITKTKYLGVIINEKLKWNDHIDHIRKKFLGGVTFCQKLGITLINPLLK